MTIAVIGAGMAGLSAARALSARGRDVVVFDKGRGPGGRMATRREAGPSGTLRFDHGAQFFTAQSAAFRDQLAELVAAGAAAPWEARLVAFDLGGAPSPLREAARFVGTPGMSSVIRALAEGLDTAWSRRVAAIEPSAQGPRLRFEEGETEGPYEAALCAVPAEQAAMLLEGPAPALAAEAAAATSAPCWAVMLAFETELAVPWDGAKLAGRPLAWVARNASKPGRAAAETWVLHAGPDWSRLHLEEAPDTVTQALVADFQALTGAPAPDFAGAHRWRYAQVMEAASTPAAFDPDSRIGVCGDWRIGPRVEAAWLSGAALGTLV